MGEAAPEGGLDVSLYDAICEISIIDDHAHPYCNSLYRETIGVPAFDDDLFLIPGPGTFRPLADLYLHAFEKLYGYRAAILDEKTRAEMLRVQWEAERGPSEIYGRAQEVAGVESSAILWFEKREDFPPPRFRLIPPIDPLFYPLGDAGLPAPRSHLARANVRLFTTFSDRFQAEYGRPMPSFDSYLEFVTDRIDAYAQAVCPAVKILSLYARPLEYHPASLEEARAAYEKAGTSPDSYSKLQNYLIRYSLAQCVAHGLPVQVHAVPGGANRTRAESSPLNLMPLMEDPELADIKLVLLHGGWGVEEDTRWFLDQYPNVYLDMSALPLFWLPSQLAAAIRGWLEMTPGLDGMAARLIYGSDNLGIAHHYVVAGEGARRALDIALSGMIKDGIINRELALEIAQRFLRENARTVYGL